MLCGKIGSIEKQRVRGVKRAPSVESSEIAQAIEPHAGSTRKGSRTVKRVGDTLEKRNFAESQRIH
jgi:hypothetical protein